MIVLIQLFQFYFEAGPEYLNDNYQTLPRTLHMCANNCHRIMVQICLFQSRRKGGQGVTTGVFL